MHSHQVCFGTIHIVWLLLTWQDCDLKHRLQDSRVSSTLVSSLSCPKDHWPRGMKPWIYHSQTSVHLSPFTNSSLLQHQSKPILFTHLSRQQLIQSQAVVSDVQKSENRLLWGDVPEQTILKTWVPMSGFFGFTEKVKVKPGKSRIKAMDMGTAWKIKMPLEHQFIIQKQRLQGTFR